MKLIGLSKFIDLTWLFCEDTNIRRGKSKIINRCKLDVKQEKIFDLTRPKIIHKKQIYPKLSFSRLMKTYRNRNI